MNGNLSQFGEDLRAHLLRLQVCLNQINFLFGELGATDPDLQTRQAELNALRTEASGRVLELRNHLDSGVRSIAESSVTKWIELRQTAQLHARADLMERLATMAAELATLSALEAEDIILAAILARRQAIAVQVQCTTPKTSTFEE